MPWCPKCKNEYKDGFTVCADCGCELVDSLEEKDVPIYFGQEEEIDNIIAFFKANNIENVSKLYDEKENTFELLVKKGMVEDAKRVIRVYLREFTIPEEKEPEEKEDLTINIYEDSNKRAEEYKSGAYTLLLVGIIGVIILVLLNLNIITLNLTQISKILITGVMGIMFVIFIILGFSSLKTCKKLKMNAEDESKQQEEIKEWFLNDFTKEILDESINALEETEEELYFKRADKMKLLIKEKYPSIKVEFLDYIVEDLYERIYE